MADTLKRFAGPLQLTTSSATIYTVPAATTSVIRSIHISRGPSGSSTGFTLSIGADAAATRLWDAYAILSGDYFSWTGNIVLNAAETLRAFASAATTLTIVVNGVEIA